LQWKRVVVEIYRPHGGTVDELLAAVAGAAAGGVVGAVTSYLQVRRSYRLGTDQELRNARLGAYVKVWAALKPLSTHRDQPPSPRELHQLVSVLTDWYYDVGGLYLTSQSQPAFVELVRHVKEAADEGVERDTPVEGATHASLYVWGSRFRSHLTLDLRSRDEAAFQTRRHKRLRTQVLGAPKPALLLPGRGPEPNGK
jgi:hypothetical protein